MRTKQALSTALICAFALGFNAFANVVYDQEVTNTWFSVVAKDADLSDTEHWTLPKVEGNTAVVADSVIKLDTDIDDPLTYSPGAGCSGIAIVSAQIEATASAATPTFSELPQAALMVCVNEAETNWYGLVATTGGAEWKKFDTVIPEVGTTYDVKIEFDLRDAAKRIRYSVGGTVLRENDGDGWYGNPKTGVTTVGAVSFVGTGNVGDFGGSDVVEAAAAFNGQNYTTFQAALGAARATWSAGTPVVLYKDAAYDASATEILYVNANGHQFTINGSVAVDVDGNTYTITAGDACEARIGTAYYSTIEKAIAAAEANETIVVNKDIAKPLAFSSTSVTLDTNGKSVTCAALTVASGVTLTLAKPLAVTDANIDGSVAGAALTVNGTLTGTAVAVLAFGDSATFAYADAPLAATTLTIGNRLTISGLGSVQLGDVIIGNAGEYDASKFVSAVALPEGLMLGKDGAALKVVEMPPDIEVELGDDTAGYDFTNGTVNVKTTVQSGKGGSVVLKYVDFGDGGKKTLASQTVTESGTVAWDLSELMPGGTYSYEIEVRDSADKLIDTKYGTFTAANWAKDVWFGANATSGADVRTNGSWVGGVAPTIAEGAYVIEEGSTFSVTDQSKGSNNVVRVDVNATFESLTEGESLEIESGALGGFVAATDNDGDGVWKALTVGDGNSDPTWVELAGAVMPEANKPYVIRAEVSFLTDKKQVRYLVSEDGGASFFALFNGESQWLKLADETKDSLANVELRGSGKVAMFAAKVADRALAEVEGVAYTDLAAALAAAKANGKPVRLLTNVTIETTVPGTYEIMPDGYRYVSGGKVSSEERAIVVDESGKPVVRPGNNVMAEVKTPDGKPFKDIDKLRKFLEKNNVGTYKSDDATAQEISEALKEDGDNGLKLWQDYVLGIDSTDPVAPVTAPAGDTDSGKITLAIPAIDKSKCSGDYTVSYQVLGAGDAQKEVSEDPAAIKIPLETGTFKVKAVFTPAK